MDGRLILKIAFSWTPDSKSRKHLRNDKREWEDDTLDKKSWKTGGKCSVNTHLCECLCMSWKKDKKTQSGTEPRHGSQFQTSLRSLCGNATSVPITHLYNCSHSPVELPLFYACLAFVGPSLYHASLQTSGHSFCCPISSLIEGGQRRAGVQRPTKSLSITLGSCNTDTDTMMRREKKQPGCKWVKLSSHPQGSCLCQQLPANETRPRHQRPPAGARPRRRGCETTAA